MEAMASGRPVICLDLGGPAIQVNEQTGSKIEAITPEQTVSEIAAAMQRLSLDSELRVKMGLAGKALIKQHYSWRAKGAELARLYEQIVA